MRYFGVCFSLFVVACATEVTQDIPTEGEDPGGSGGSSAQGGSAAQGGSSSSTSGTGTGAKAGSGTSAFGGSASTGGTGSSGSASTGGKGGAGGAGGAGTGGKASGGSAGASAGGSASGGKGGAGGAGMGGTTAGGTGGTAAGGSSAGSPPVGTGDCAGTPAFELGSGSKYALNAAVVAVCSGGTPCTLAMPPLTAGKTYEFKCKDQYNCGAQDPGKTNWSQPPWVVSKACEE
ncbi:MAG: hypothetical protein EOO73_25805 [Myxococcales bacterium]|nr:MAG: hypothetical protein EOO73_25805 [Myxococcales bacterium]